MSDQKEPLFELRKHDLKVANFSGTEDTRPMLQNILVRINDQKQIEMVTTDSYLLIKHKPRDFVGEPFEPFLMPASVLHRVNKLVPLGTKYKPAPVIQVFSDHIVLLGIGVTLEFKPTGESIVDKYPNVDKLLAEFDRKGDGHVKLQAKLIKKVVDFLDQPEYGGGIDLTINAKMAPVEFVTPLTYAVVMPLKA